MTAKEIDTRLSEMYSLRNVLSYAEESAFFKCYDKCVEHLQMYHSYKHSGRSQKKINFKLRLAQKWLQEAETVFNGE